VAEKAAGDPPLDGAAAEVESVRRQEIDDDRIIVSRVKGDVVAARLGDCPDRVERLVAVERRDLIATTFSISANSRQKR